MFPRRSARTKKPLVVSELNTYDHPQSEGGTSEVEEGDDDIRATNSKSEHDGLGDEVEGCVVIIPQSNEQQTFTIDSPPSSCANPVAGRGDNEANVLHVVKSPPCADHHEMREDVSLSFQRRLRSNGNSRMNKDFNLSKHERDSGLDEKSEGMDAGFLRKQPSLNFGLPQHRKLRHDLKRKSNVQITSNPTKRHDDGRPSKKVRFVRDSPHLQRTESAETCEQGASTEAIKARRDDMDLFRISHEYVSRVLDDAIFGEGNSEGRGRVLGGSEGFGEAKDRKDQIPEQGQDLRMTPITRRLHFHKKLFDVGKRVNFEDVGRKVLEGLITKREHKRIYTIRFENGSDEDLVLASERFFVFGTALKRFISDGLVSRDDITTECFPCERNKLIPVHEDAKEKVMGREQLVEFLRVNDCLLVCCRWKSRFLAGKVIFVEIGECFRVKLFREERQKWVAPRAMRESCVEIIELD